MWVYVQDGKVIRTEGDETCFNTMGNHCSKGQASIRRRTILIASSSDEAHESQGQRRSWLGEDQLGRGVSNYRGQHHADT
ncbi:MAG: hypothetical protein ACLT98_10445 [Eggerthellaceae bacterium]